MTLVHIRLGVMGHCMGSAWRARCLLELDPLNWVIVHKEGNQQINTDALSHRPIAEDMSVTETSGIVVHDVNLVSDERPEGDAIYSVSVEVIAEETVVNPSLKADHVMSLSALLGEATDIVSMQQNDPDLDVVHHWVEQSQQHLRRTLAGASQCLRKHWTEFNHLKLINLLLCCSVSCLLTGDPVAQVVVPSGLNSDILLQLHGTPTAAHFSPERVWEQPRHFCYWLSMFKDIYSWSAQCTPCQT